MVRQIGLLLIIISMVSGIARAQTTPITDLYGVVAAACGNCIQGIRIGQINDKATWNLDFLPSATADQIAQATAALSAFDLNAWQSAQSAKSNYSDAVGAGITISSKSAPNLNGTYAIDSAARSNIDGIYSGIKNGDGLPGNGPTFNYADSSGVFHSFTPDQFMNFAKAVRDYIYGLSQGQSVGPVSIP